MSCHLINKNEDEDLNAMTVATFFENTRLSFKHILMIDYGCQWQTTAVGNPSNLHLLSAGRKVTKWKTCTAQCVYQIL